MRLDHGLARLCAVGVHGECSNRERPANRVPDAVVECYPLELAEMRAPVTRHGCRIADRCHRESARRRWTRKAASTAPLTTQARTNKQHQSRLRQYSGMSPEF